MAIAATLTYRYLPGPVDPVGYEVIFKVSDPVNGGAGQDFATTIQILPENAKYWSLDAATSAIQFDPATGIRTPASAYDPDGITAGWTSRISNNNAANAQTVFSLRGKFDALTGLIQIKADCVQLTDPLNKASTNPPILPSPPNPPPNTTGVSVVIPAPKPL
jgi:hypothetical protein